MQFITYIFGSAIYDLSNQYHNDILDPFRHRKIPGQFIFCSQITLPISPEEEEEEEGNEVRRDDREATVGTTERWQATRRWNEG